MNDTMKFLLTSSIVGILLTSIINLIISIKSLKHQKEVESYKASISFLNGKLNSLMKIKPLISEFTSMEDLYNSVKESDESKSSESAFKWLMNNRNAYLKQREVFKKIKSYLPPKSRILLETCAKEIDDIESKQGEYITLNMNKFQSHTPIGENEELSDFKKTMMKNMSLSDEFKRILNEAVDTEMERISDILSGYKAN
jgi:hypothetical protein